MIATAPRRRAFSPRPQRRLGAFAALALALLAPSLTASARQPQQPAPVPQTIRIVRVEFAGLERVTQAEAVAASGLVVGQETSLEALGAAAQKLLDSGLFRNLSYTVKGRADDAIIVFDVGEPKRNAPVVFDNFVWFGREELNEAVRRRVPGFDGTAPGEAGAATDAITKALQDLLRERKIEGQVEYAPSADPTGRHPEHLFTVTGTNLRVCELKFPGTRTIRESVLVENSSGIFNNEYSQRAVAGYVESKLLPLYHERGFLRASFVPPQAKLLAGGECEGGVAVTVQIDEGSAYVWDGAVWSGNESLGAAELDAALAMRPKEVADGVRVVRGLEAVRKAYTRAGRLDARVTAAPDFDDTNRRVVYRFQVAEGPLYRMGQLFIEGLPEAETNNLRGRWSLLSKEPYDAGYLDVFLKKGVREFAAEAQRNGRALPANIKVEGSARPDPEKLLVDVTINFKQ